MKCENTCKLKIAPSDLDFAEKSIEKVNRFIKGFGLHRKSAVNIDNPINEYSSHPRTDGCLNMLHVIKAVRGRALVEPRHTSVISRCWKISFLKSSLLALIVFPWFEKPSLLASKEVCTEI